MAVTRMLVVGGCPRSGTTVMGSSLGASPMCIVPPESGLRELLLAVESGRVRPTVPAIREFVSQHWRFQLWGLRLEPRPLDVDPAAGPWAVVRAVLVDVVDQYAATAGKPGATVWVDHTPDTIRVAPLLDRVFPDTRYVHLVRDGRAVMASVLSLDWGPNDPEEAAHWWSAWLSYGLALTARLGERLVETKFEAFVTNPSNELERISTAVGIGYDPRMLSADGLAVPAYTRGQHKLVGGAIDPKAATSWRKRLEARDIEIFEHHAGDLLAIMGYEPLNRTPTRLTLPEMVRHRVLARSVRALRNRFARERRRVRGLQAANPADSIE